MITATPDVMVYVTLAYGVAALLLLGLLAFTWRAKRRLAQGVTPQ